MANYNNLNNLNNGQLLALVHTTQTPAYVLDEAKLIHNLQVLKLVQDQSGCKILLAQKAFSMFAVYPLLSEYLDGTTASGLYEARLGREHFPGEVHIFSPAYRFTDMLEIAEIADHIVYNSLRQFEQLSHICQNAGKSIGLRINPECSTQETAIYDPCAPGSRLGILAEDLNKFANHHKDLMRRVDGLHFHTLCEQNADALECTLKAVEEKFSKYLYKCKWVNFGGGHHITRPDYDRDLLIRLIKNFSEKYQVQVYLEPGEAIALNAGYLVTEILDIVENHGTKILILDTSASCHMPDVLEMPYKPPLFDAGQPGEKRYTYRLSSYTCLAGDIIGDYSFDHELQIGDRLCFEDMMIYSMVKNNTFNGMPLPDIGILHKNYNQYHYEILKKFDYQDFKERLS
ncbi:MAG: carboxynorspermidine decarboxylase [Oscillospiraceae bacterium]|nr:carboxynorspermidine decarboxylase [Oscillospiraceae bacterium]